MKSGTSIATVSVAEVPLCFSVDVKDESLKNSAQVRITLQLLTMLLAGLCMGFAVQTLVPGGVPGWVGWAFAVFAAPLVVASWRLTDKYIKEHKAYTAETQSKREFVDTLMVELADTMAKIRLDHLRSGTDDASTAVIRENAMTGSMSIVGEVNEDGVLVPVTEPGFAALVLDKVANQLRWEALQQAARDDKTDDKTED